ncbi:MAG: PilZ domain-containing protein [Pseudomonadota bacterium]
MARVIEVGRVERRRDWRRQILLDALLDGHPIKLVDVSGGGFGAVFEIEGEGHLLPDQGSKVKMVVFLDGAESESFDIEITRIDPVTGRFGAHLLPMSDRQFKLIERLTLGRKY